MNAPQSREASKSHLPDTLEQRKCDERKLGCHLPRGRVAAPPPSSSGSRWAEADCRWRRSPERCFCCCWSWSQRPSIRALNFTARPHALSYARHLQLCFSVHLYTRARTKTLSHSHAHTPPLNRGSSGTHPDDQSVWSGRRRKDRCSGSALLFLPVFVGDAAAAGGGRGDGGGVELEEMGISRDSTSSWMSKNNRCCNCVQCGFKKSPKKRKRFNQTSKR